jgi:diguanylate cyclase (GGDEF)-like protein
MASNLDREALVELAVRTAVDGVAADGGRVRVLARGADDEITSGDAPDHVAELVAESEREALATGQPREVATDDGAAVTHPLRGAAGGAPIGVVSVWRHAKPFAPSERELFHYLAGQVGISLENVSLHETVQRQAVTDELTGLDNHRRFQGTLSSEIERARRFEQSLGLVMLDVDNFKKVNDTYGHQVGDQVLRDVSRVLRETSREVDAPARYGGEELACVLPGTDLDGAYQFAERVRQGIEALRVPTGSGEPLQVTASFGAATLPGQATDQAALIAAADAALYEAKRTGKNRTVRAG